MPKSDNSSTSEKEAEYCYLCSSLLTNNDPGKNFCRCFKKAHQKCIDGFDKRQCDTCGVRFRKKLRTKACCSVIFSRYLINPILLGTIMFLLCLIPLGWRLDVFPFDATKLDTGWVVLGWIGFVLIGIFVCSLVIFSIAFQSTYCCPGCYTTYSSAHIHNHTSESFYEDYWKNECCCPNSSVVQIGMIFCCTILFIIANFLTSHTIGLVLANLLGEKYQRFTHGFSLPAFSVGFMILLFMYLICGLIGLIGCLIRWCCCTGKKLINEHTVYQEYTTPK